MSGAASIGAPHEGSDVVVRSFDVHRHLAPSSSEDPLFEVPARGEHAVWVGTGGALGGGHVPAAVHTPSYYVLTEGIEATRRLNDLLYAAVDGDRGHPTVAVGTAEPHHGEASLAEVDRLALDLGFTAISWRPRAQGVFADAPMMVSLVARAAERGMVPMVHASPGSGNEALWRVWRLAEQLPSAPVVVIGALSDWDQQQEVLAQPDRGANVVYDLTRFFGEAENIAGLVDRLGTHRVVFGSGAGCDGPLDATLTAGVIAGSELPDAVKRAVLWDNAARLFQLDGGPE